MKDFWSRPIENFKIPKVGSKTLQSFHKAGLQTVLDVLMQFPLRFKKKITCKNVSIEDHEQEIYIEGVVIQSSPYPPPKPVKFFKAVIKDLQGTYIELVFFQQHPWIIQQLQTGKRVRAYGKIINSAYGWQMSHPEVENVQRDQPIVPLIEPVYSKYQGIGQKTLSDTIRFFIAYAEHHKIISLPLMLEHIKILHAIDISQENLKNFDALWDKAHQNMAYWEGVAYFRQLLARQNYFHGLSASSLKKGDTVEAVLKAFGHPLTEGQKKIWNDLSHELDSTVPVNRLIQGDVGSGKTILGFLALATALDSGGQAVFMAPTELLAQQHYDKLCRLLPRPETCVLLTGSLSASARKNIYEGIATGKNSLVIGTHAVFQEHVQFARLVLVVIDEQQRFGVAQRTRLLQKSSDAVHQIILTATPIPRTLAQSLVGQQGYWILKDKPLGRQKIQTFTVPSSSREIILKSLLNALNKKHSVYWVCPFISESESMDVHAAIQSYEKLLEEPLLAPYKIGLIHGKMPFAERQSVLKDFYEQRYHVLVSTLVIEVGIDDPKANLMIIESPERLGLAQLHQLRGRVGRGNQQSYCLLVYDSNLSEQGLERLRALCTYDDGFSLAEIDLEMRGPGEFIGARQSGFSEWRFFDLKKHRALLDPILKNCSMLSDQQQEYLDLFFGKTVSAEYWDC